MSGQDGSRGYLYQAFACILEALDDKSWDKIHVEFQTKNDKVDIALESDDKIIKTIQVKSSINLFTDTQIEKWLLELIRDYNSDEYLVYLIGACKEDANKLVKSFKKKNKGIEDNESKESLKSMDTELLSKKISIKVIPIEQGTLESIVRDSLHKYISSKGCILSHEGLDLMAKGIIYTFMALSTDGKSILKQEFDEKIFKWVELNSGGFFKTKDAKAEHEIMFYDKCKHSFYNMMEEVNISEFEGYKSLRDDYIHRISELVRNINKIQLNSHSLEVMKKEKEDSKDDEIYLNTPQINGLTGFSSDSFKIFDSQMKNLNSLRLWANNRKESYLEKEDDEKEELILELKEILGIEIKKSFFNLGELKRETEIYYFQNNEDKIIGTIKEKVKYEYIEKLDEVMNDYRVLKHFINKISNCSIISLIIKNINSVSDDNITIKIYMPRSVEIFKSSNYELDEILQLVPKRLAEIDGVIEKIFKVKSDSLVMKEKKEREYDYRILKKPFHIPLYSDYNEGYTNKDFYEILENNIKQNVYNDDDEYQVIEYKINKLNPSEIKALGNNIVIYSLKEDIEIKYGITSSNSDGSISGILQLKKLIGNT